MNNFLNLLKELIKFILDACIFFLGLAKHLLLAAKEWFIYIPVSEKIIVLNLIPSFFAASMDSASFKIADFEKGVTNPYAAYLVGISLFMIISSFYRNKFTFAGRIGFNLIYLIAIIYLNISGSITKPQNFEYSVFFYFNYLVALLNITASLLSRFVYFK
ncbi:MAG: hypothetical protein KA015_03085 [Spirochaetes bacterium]|nr:hypothetical protein [Spirochaetota bacterium]